MERPLPCNGGRRIGDSLTDFVGGVQTGNSVFHSGFQLRNSTCALRDCFGADRENKRAVVAPAGQIELRDSVFDLALDLTAAFSNAYVQECAFIGADKLDQLAAIKTKEELIGDIIALLQSPIQRIISGLENASEGKADDEKVGSAKPAAEEAPAAEAPAAEEAPAAAEAAPAAEETATE